MLSRDLFYDRRRGAGPGGALAADLETAAVLAVARRRGIRAPETDARIRDRLGVEPLVAALAPTRA